MITLFPIWGDRESDIPHTPSVYSSMPLKNHSVDAEIEVISGEPPRTEEVILKDYMGWQTSLRSAGSRLFVAKKFPSDVNWSDGEGETICQTIEQIEAEMAEDFTGTSTSGFHDERFWLLISLPEAYKSKNFEEEWNNAIGLASIDVEVEVRQGKETSFQIPDRPLPPLQGRPLLLSALVDKNNNLIKNLVDSIVDRMEDYWECAMDNNSLGVKLQQSRKTTHELLHNQNEQPHRFSEDKWVRPNNEEEIREWLIGFNPSIGEPDGNIRTICAKKSHGDLWSDNFIFSITQNNVKAFPIDPFHVVYRGSDASITCVNYPNINHKLKSRYCFEHEEDPIPNPLHDIGQLIASILISLPFQDTQPAPHKGPEIEKKKNTIMTKYTNELRKCLLESFSPKPQKYLHVVRNVHTFLDAMYELVEDINTGYVAEADQNEVREHMTLMLVDRILFYSGFILGQRGFRKNKDRRDEFVSYVVNILNVISQQNIVEE